MQRLKEKRHYDIFTFCVETNKLCFTVVRFVFLILSSVQSLSDEELTTKSWFFALNSRVCASEQRQYSDKYKEQKLKGWKQLKTQENLVRWRSSLNIKTTFVISIIFYHKKYIKLQLRSTFSPEKEKFPFWAQSMKNVSTFILNFFMSPDRQRELEKLSTSAFFFCFVIIGILIYSLESSRCLWQCALLRVMRN